MYESHQRHARICWHGNCSCLISMGQLSSSFRWLSAFIHRCERFRLWSCFWCILVLWWMAFNMENTAHLIPWANMMALIRKLVITCMQFNVQIYAKHILGKSNMLADFCLVYRLSSSENGHLVAVTSKPPLQNTCYHRTGPSPNSSGTAFTGTNYNKRISTFAFIFPVIFNTLSFVSSLACATHIR